MRTLQTTSLLEHVLILFSVKPPAQPDLKAARVEHIVEYTIKADTLQVVALIAALVCLPLHTAISHSFQPSDSEPDTSTTVWIAICVGVIVSCLFFVAGVVRSVAREKAGAGSATEYKATYDNASGQVELIQLRSRTTVSTIS